MNIYIKRDDLLPGAAGGNKTRKLEFCLADALEKGADAIITCGAVQSNHCRLTAAWSAKEVGKDRGHILNNKYWHIRFFFVLSPHTENLLKSKTEAK